MDPLATDVLVEILRRLPPNSRRSSRLVCRCWRNLVDKRTVTNLQSRAKTLLVAWDGTAFVLGDNVGQSPRKVLVSTNGQNSLSVICTCNGLICLCDANKAPGAITLANPATGNRLELPPLHRADIITHFNPAWQAAYSFAHHQTTGRYKVVHLPCCFDSVYEFDMVQVFTLGEASWREVPTPKFGEAGARCCLDIGVISVDGTIYWVAEGTDKIMSFDLGDECVAAVEPLPMEAKQVDVTSFRFRRHLAEVGGRLAMAILYGWWMVEKTDVWVLESARGEQTWTLRYTLEIRKVTDQEWLTPQLMLPHFTHGEHLFFVNEQDLILYLTRKSSDGACSTSAWGTGR